MTRSASTSAGVVAGDLRRLLASLALAAAFSLVLLAIRSGLGGSRSYDFLAWNLFLAALPLACALALEAAAGRRPVSALLALLWLAFFPNAPYVVTDFVHLRPDPPVPLWLDVLLFTSFAWTSLVLGFVSLERVRTLLPHRPAVERAALLVLFVLSALAIYLGRFAQWNSWDLVAHPFGIVRAVVSPASAAKEVEFVAGFAAFLAVAYAVFAELAAAVPRRR